MLTIAFIEARKLMRRRLIGASANDPVLPSTDRVEQRSSEPVDRRRPAQSRAHVARVAPQAAGSNENLC